MMKKLQRLGFIIGLLLATFTVRAQIQVQGTVTTEEDGQGLPGVNVVVQGTTNGTVTDIDGNYSIELQDPQTSLVFSFIGYSTQTIAVNSQTQINVVMQPDINQLDEVVVIGYGTVRKSDLTGAVSQVRGEDLTEVPGQNVIQSLQGKVTGVQVTSASGEPGASPRVLIRGVGTFGNSEPLYVVDGVLLRSSDEINYLNPNDIESMEILKDASAAAIYGARGSNGVVIITTKSGKAGTTKFNVNLSTGKQYLADKIDLLNGPEYAELINEIFPGTFDPATISDTDWQDAVFDEGTPMVDANISASGGTDKMDYYISFGYFKQEGIVPSSDYQRFTLKLNNNYQLTDKFKVGHNLTFARTHENFAPNVTQTAYRAQPVLPVYNADGSFAEQRITGNPLASIEYNNNRTNGFQAVGNMYAQYNILENLSAKSSIGLSAFLNDNQVFSPIYEVGANQRNDVSRLNVRKSEDVRWFWENTLNYNREWADHRLDAVVGFTMQSVRNEFIFGSTPNLVRTDDNSLFLGNGQPNTDDPNQLEDVDGNGLQSSLVSFLFRANYSFQNKYLLTLTGRIDGSSVFPENDKYGFFPAIGLGWNIAEEDFMQNNSSINILKLRASYGILGSDNVSNEERYSTIQSNTGAVFGPTESLFPGSALGNISNNRIKWEETRTYDFGLEFGLLENRLTGEIDYYNRLSDDVLTGVAVPGFFGNGGFTNVTFNTVTVENSGLELMLGWQDQKGDFSYGIGFNATTLKNEVKDLGFEEGQNSFITNGSLNNGDNVTRTTAGEEVGSFFGYEIAGIFQSEQEVTDFPSLNDQGVGDFRFVDQNGDDLITDADRVFLGSAIPDLLYGFNFSAGYKGIGISLDFQGQSGNEIFNGKRLVRPEIYNYQGFWRDRWTTENTSTDIPRASAGGANFDPSEFFVEDGSFLRLRSVSLSYELPSNLLEPTGFTLAKIYVRGTNVFTSTDYSGYTPEIRGGDNILSNGIDLGVYPVTSVYTLGLNLTF